MAFCFSLVFYSVVTRLSAPDVSNSDEAIPDCVTDEEHASSAGNCNERKEKKFKHSREDHRRHSETSSGLRDHHNSLSSSSQWSSGVVVGEAAGPERVDGKGLESFGIGWKTPLAGGMYFIIILRRTQRAISA
uniref:(northern house mosquito) hypothetical protein n=1 Tax=Culex pipiens TaxID=7175 RepID=A0A8D8CUI5_CULPI